MEQPWHEYLRLWAALVISIGSLVWMVWWSVTMTRKSAAKAEQDKIGAELASLKDAVAKDERADADAFGAVEKRLQRVEDELRHIPTKADFHKLEMSLGEMKSDVREMSASIRPVMSSIERINDYLMGAKA